MLEAPRHYHITLELQPPGSLSPIVTKQEQLAEFS
jgi:hypothetical protein